MSSLLSMVLESGADGHACCCLQTTPRRVHGDSLHTLLRASVVAVGLAVEPGAAPDAEDPPNPHICSAAARRGAAAGKQLVVGRRGG